MAQEHDVLGYLQSKGVHLKRAGGYEVNVPCMFHGEDPGKRGRLYINVDPRAEIPGLYYCLAGETEVLTWDGYRPIKGLAGSTHRLMTDGGRWVDAPVRSFGQQRLMRLVLQRNKSEKVIYATPEHRWFVRGSGLREVQTRDLRPGHPLAYAFGQGVPEVERKGWRVVAVEETDRSEEVFCAVVEGTHRFVIEGNILTGNCHVCGEKGNLVTLKRHYGDQATGQDEESFDRLEIFRLASKFYQRELLLHEDVLDWLHGPERMLADESIKRFQIGYAPQAIEQDLGSDTVKEVPTRSLYRHLRDLGYEAKDILSTGLCVERNGKIVDSLAGMVTIPYQVTGSVVDIRGRTWPDRDDRPKYKTCSGRDTRLFNTDALWNVEEVIATEGEFDAIVMSQLGYNAVAFPGAKSWQDGWESYFGPLRRVWLIFDRDKAGEEGAEKVVSKIGAKARRIHLSDVGFKCDPTQWVAKGNGAEQFEELISAARRGNLLVSVDEAIQEFDSIQDMPGLKFGWEVLDVMIEPGLQPTQLFIVLAKTGCLTGDTEIAVNRGGNGFKIQLEKMFERWSGAKYAWDRSTPTYVQRAVDGVVRLGEVAEVWDSGIKPVFTLTTEEGRSITATAEHPFFTPGGWKKLSELEVGSEVYVNAGRSTKGRTEKSHYYYRSGLIHHPHRGRRNVRAGGNSVPLHRLVVEARMNGLELDEFLLRCRSDGSGLAFLDPAEWAVHHIDHNPFNNEYENLKVLTREEHAAIHADEGTSRNVLEQVGVETVRSIESAGEQQTYDISMVDEPHNFMANGFAVHNTGKALRWDQRVAVPGGWAKIAELQPGDYVIGSNGLPTRVVGVFPQGEREMVELTFSDGAKVVCDYDHLWTYQTRNDTRHGRWRTTTTTEMLKHRASGVYFPTIHPVEGERVAGMDPYTLGALIGDGSFKYGSTYFSSVDQEVLGRLELQGTELLHTGSGCDYRFSGRKGVENPVSRSLRELGLWGLGSHEKFIPDAYLHASVDQRIELLRGLMDTDGTIDRNGACEFGTTSRRLAEQVVDLVRSLGGVTGWNGQAVRTKRTTHRDFYRVSVRLPFVPFHLTRKVERWRAPSRVVRSLRSVEPVGRDQVVCIKVAADDELFATEGYVLTHNTIMLLNVMDRMRRVSGQEDLNVLFISLEQTRGEWWDRARRIYRFYNMEENNDDAARRWWRDNIFLIDRNRLTEQDLRIAIEDFEEQRGRRPDLIALDYLGYWAQSFKGERYERVSDAVMSLKAMAKDLRVPIIVPHQVSRVGRDGEEFGADAARDSGVIEETADFLLTLWTPDNALGRSEEEKTGRIHARIAKSRHGGRGVLLNLQFAPLSLVMLPENDPRCAAARREITWRRDYRDNWEKAIYRHRTGFEGHLDHVPSLAEQIGMDDVTLEQIHEYEESRYR